MTKYRIRDRNQIKDIILPIFDQLPLLTSKFYKYSLWKNGLEIWESEISLNEKIEKIEKIRKEIKMIPINYKSPIWLNKDLTDIKIIKEILNKYWVGGYTEGDGSFYLVKKEKNRISPGFGISKKLDSYILECLRKLFHIKAKLRIYPLKAQLNTTNKRSINNIKNYYKNLLISQKALEYKIWCKAIYYNDKDNKKK